VKKAIIISITVVVISGALAASVFYTQQLKGIWPAVSKPSQNIVELIPSVPSGALVPADPVNNTDMPLTLNPGFSISIFAKDLGKPRVMIPAPEGGLLVSIPSEGRVVLVKDTDNNNVADVVRTVIGGLNRPHGLAIQCVYEECSLYIAESDKVALYKYDQESYKAYDKKELFDLPDGGNHFTRTLLIMPFPNDDTLLTSVGSSCNVCNESDWRRAKILRSDLDGSGLRTFASGLRNAVFMAIHPVTGDIWATEMGRDLLGDDIPPDEINIIKDGRNYGWPTCYGQNIHDTNFDKNIYIRDPCREPTEAASLIDIPAHSAPLGLGFVPEEGWPTEYWYDLFVAYHGSWNRSIPTGYKIVRYILDEEGNYVGEVDSTGSPLPEDFISGWLTNKSNSLGRPVDILVQPGGVMYISDDKAGVIYQVAYREKVDVSDLIHVSNLKEGDVVRDSFKIHGEARGFWYFEADFPVRMYDGDGKEIAVAIAQAQGDWMTEQFVPFEVELEFQTPSTENGTVVFERDNPSGLPEHDAELIIPVRFQ